MDRTRMTKEEACKALGLKVFDYAVPQDWFVKMLEITCSEENPLAHFVWSYDAPNTWGVPRPLTKKGVELLKRYNEKFGTAYPTDYNVLDI